jgi:maltose alpha-D-glucosyltransferase/alpha-amylase
MMDDATSDDLRWYKNAVFYEVYLRAFFDSNGDGHGDLCGLMERLDYLQELGVDCIWLLPIYPSPLKDDGYDIADYYGVQPTYGSLHDFKQLLEMVHARGMHLIMDLVLNHTSDQHPWFQEARKIRESPYRDYYVWSDTDQKYKDARIIFVDTEPSNWTWDETAGQYYWHRFYACQPDLNYENPQVRAEMLNVMKFWLAMGVDGFRADAVPYLFERDGTNCENLPETHAYLKEIRAFIDKHYPGKVLLAEANQWPEDVRLYFGDGDEFHMGFHFPVMPRIFMALRSGDRSPIVDILNHTPPIPEECQWCIFLRNHDELTLEMVTEEEREWMWKEYAPEPRMQLNLGIRRRLAPLLDNDRRKIELAQSLLFSLTGSPIIYYGDEIGMGDNIWLDDRNGVRTPMQWQDGFNAGFSKADPSRLYLPVIDSPSYGPAVVNVAAQTDDADSLFHTTQRMISIRRQHPAFGRGKFAWFPVESKAVIAYWRVLEDERMIILNNLSDQTQTISIDPAIIQAPEIYNLSSGEFRAVIPGKTMTLTLTPYQYAWWHL